MRPGSGSKLSPELEAAAEVVEDEASAFDGVHTVVSAVQGGPNTNIDTQHRLLSRARAGGVRRFIPSDFSFDLFGLAEGENINSDWRREFARRAGQERGAVQVVHLWGDGEAQMQFTTYEVTLPSLQKRRSTMVHCPIGSISRESPSISSSSSAKPRQASGSTSA